MINRLGKTLVALAIGGVVFLAAYVIEIGVDVWVVNHEGPTGGAPKFPPSPPPTHVRHYVLPLGGLALGALILLRRALPAGQDALRTVEARGPFRMVFKYALRALGWASVAMAIFQTASWLQWQLFGFFLPP